MHLQVLLGSYQAVIIIDIILYYNKIAFKRFCKYTFKDKNYYKDNLYYVNMVFYTAWKQEYNGDSALEEIHGAFYRIYEVLLNLGHPLESLKDIVFREIHPNKEEAYASYILADKMPIAIAYVSAEKSSDRSENFYK